MINIELENLAKKLVKNGYHANEIRNIAGQYLSNENLEALWSVPRKNINNFVIDCFNNLDLKSPFLDIGCGKRSYQPEVIKKFGEDIKYIALDHYSPKDDKIDPLRLPNLIADVAHMPITSSTINTVICAELLEHVKNDNMVLKEISRVTKSSGLLILTLPGVDIPKHDKLPYQIDYRRYKLGDIEKLLKSTNFDILKAEQKKLSSLEINLFVIAKRK